MERREKLPVCSLAFLASDENGKDDLTNGKCNRAFGYGISSRQHTRRKDYASETCNNGKFAVTVVRQS